MSLLPDALHYSAVKAVNRPFLSGGSELLKIGFTPQYKVGRVIAPDYAPSGKV
jgi:hypothetical protein